MQLIIVCLAIWSSIGWALAWHFHREARKARQQALEALAGKKLTEYHARLLNALLRQAVEANKAPRERVQEDDYSSEAWKRQ